MKKVWAIAILLAIGAGLLFVFKSKNPAPENPAIAVTSPAPEPAPVPEKNPAPPAALQNPERVPPISPAAAGTIPTGSPVAPVVSSAATVMPISSLPPLTVLDNARVVVRNYGAAFGENPIGTNPEITEALTGKNPKQINFITGESGLRMSEQGEMVDAWGTPFFFHQLSGKEMEIRSAGEDRKMWTADDLITR